MSAGPDRSIVGSSFEISRILEEQRRQDEKRRVKRAANRRSASTSRARKKAYVDDMTAKNERMRQHAMILSMLPDLVLAVCRSGEMTYVSPACQWLLLHTPEEMIGANIFELVTQDCHALLRKMISDNLSRPVQSRESMETNASGDEAADRSDGCSSPGGTARTSMAQASTGISRGTGKRYRQGTPVPGTGSGVKDGARVMNSRVAAPIPKTPDMLRLIRCDKTTVWCESRLSVRKMKSDATSPMPVEIILTLRTVSEGKNASISHGLPGALAPLHNSGAPARAQTDTDEVEGNNRFMEEDDDGYRCEEDDDSNNSGSGNDSSSKSDSVDGKMVVGNGVPKTSSDDADTAIGGQDSSGGREQRSLLKRRKHVENDAAHAAAMANDKPVEEDCSTGGDTGGSTSQEGSGFYSNETDSYGESPNSGGSKWGDRSTEEVRFINITSHPDEYGGSEHGSTDGSSEPADSGEEVQIQDAVESLMRVRYSDGASQ